MFEFKVIFLYKFILCTLFIYNIIIFMFIFYMLYLSVLNYLEYIRHIYVDIFINILVLVLLLSIIFYKPLHEFKEYLLDNKFFNILINTFYILSLLIACIIVELILLYNNYKNTFFFLRNFKHILFMLFYFSLLFLIFTYFFN